MPKKANIWIENATTINTGRERLREYQVQS